MTPVSCRSSNQVTDILNEYMESLLTAQPPPKTSKMPSSSLHGVLNINKPAGWTSHDVVLHLRRVLGIRKIGHAGTLDPAATGVLPILLGKGTKIADHLLTWKKQYAAVLRLGQSTDTQDATGTIIQEASTDLLSDDQIQSALEEFRGEIQQIPPMYSAVKINGQPLYKSARRGETVERSARPVTIYQLEALAIRGRDVDLRVVCSKGTYIRTLCVDIGSRLQVGGHLLSLERSGVGPFHVRDSLSLEEVRDSRQLPFGKGGAFLTLDEALNLFPAVTVKSEYVTKVINGAPIPCGAIENSLSDDVFTGGYYHSYIRIRGPQGELLALGRPHGPAGRPMDGKMTMSIENVLVEK